MAEITYRDAVIRGIAQEMSRDQDVVFLGEDETAAPEYTALGTDLTEDLGPFDSAQNSGYHPFAFEQRAWLPTPQGRHWVFQGQDDATATFHQDLAEDTVILICGDLRHHLGRYPADFTDREAWFAAEQSREREHRGEGDEYTIAAGPEYGDYVIDDTFGVVRYQGKELNRAELLSAMVDSTIT